MNVKIAVCNKMTDKRYKNQMVDWAELKKTDFNVRRTLESAEEYAKMAKARKHAIKDIGGRVGGWLKEGVRKNGHVICRSIGTLDADNIPADNNFIEKLQTAFKGVEFYGTTTHSHTPKSPRWRLNFLLSREVTEDEYAPLMRMVASKIGMDFFDDTTYQANRMMFNSSAPSNGEFLTIDSQGEPLDVDKFLNEYADWHDISTWPRSSRQSELAPRTTKTQQDPLTKNGTVGAFCRAYPIMSTAIDELLPDKYEPSDIPNRYTFKGGTTHGGLIIYDEKWAYSYHQTDPACEHECNVWDLVAYHKFADLDDKKRYDAMAKWAIGLPKVQEQILKDRKQSTVDDFAVDYDSDGLPPFIGITEKGGVKVNTPKLAEYFMAKNHWFLTKGNSGKVTFWIYNGGVYNKTSENEVKGILQEYIKSYSLDLVQTRTVNEVYGVLANTRNYREIDELNNDEDIICFKNGLYKLSTDELLPHTHKHLGTVKLPLDWKPENYTKPEKFDRYLAELTDGDVEKQRVLKQFMGMAISNVRGYRTKKALFLVGKSNTGKSQLRALLEMIIGKNNCASVDLKALEAKFGTSAIHNKRLIGTNDLSYSDIPELQIFKQLTGGDSIQFEGKYADQFNDTFKGVLWFTMNKLPSFGGDRGKPVLNRICIIECGQECPEEKQNPQLLNELWQESENIIVDCVRALKFVIKNRYRYSAVASSERAIKAYERELSTAKAFIDEFYELDPHAKGNEDNRTKNVYQIYVNWCHAQQYKPVTARNFNRELADLWDADVDEIKSHTNSFQFYKIRRNNSEFDEWENLGVGR